MTGCKTTIFVYTTRARQVEYVRILRTGTQAKIEQQVSSTVESPVIPHQNFQESQLCAYPIQNVGPSFRFVGPGLVGMRRQWYCDCGMHDHENAPPKNVAWLAWPWQEAARYKEKLRNKEEANPEIWRSPIRCDAQFKVFAGLRNLPELPPVLDIFFPESLRCENRQAARYFPSAGFVF